MFQYFTSRKFESYVIPGSIAISYIIKAICILLHTIILNKITFSWNLRAIILCIIAVILAILFTKLSETNVFNKLFLKVNNKSIHSDIWDDIVDHKNGTTMQITCENVVYTGRLHFYEQKGEDSWFSLTDYTIEENGKTFESDSMGVPAVIVVRLSDAKRIELFY
uniref:hypothetical protein n=1 Tax=Coprococcus catus TaxID=116085 RepID=UPI0022E8A277|nr:hypothetical protein [Coprococcus catus]